MYAGSSKYIKYTSIHPFHYSTVYIHFITVQYTSIHPAIHPHIHERNKKTGPQIDSFMLASQQTSQHASFIDNLHTCKCIICTNILSMAHMYYVECYACSKISFKLALKMAVAFGLSLKILHS